VDEPAAWHADDVARETDRWPDDLAGEAVWRVASLSMSGWRCRCLKSGIHAAVAKNAITAQSTTAVRWSARLVPSKAAARTP